MSPCVTLVSSEYTHPTKKNKRIPRNGTVHARGDVSCNTQLLHMKSSFASENGDEQGDTIQPNLQRDETERARAQI